VEIKIDKPYTDYETMNETLLTLALRPAEWLRPLQDDFQCGAAKWKNVSPLQVKNKPQEGATLSALIFEPFSHSCEQ
jgi:hypothetical protein